MVPPQFPGPMGKAGRLVRCNGLSRAGLQGLRPFYGGLASDVRRRLLGGLPAGDPRLYQRLPLTHLGRRQFLIKVIIAGGGREVNGAKRAFGAKGS